jgi:glycine betaine catabolism B
MNAPPEPFAWQDAPIARVAAQTGRVKSYFLQPSKWRGFVAGQHVDVRLTAPDGYQAQRSYSIASAPESPEVELVVERLDEGEVSPFFHEVVRSGDAIEIRGPIGGHFTWRKQDGGPVILVGGGSGVAPLMSMLRHRANVAPEIPAVLVYSSRAMDEVIFREELLGRAEAEPNLHLILTLTREPSPDVRFRTGRIDTPLFADVLSRLGGPPRHAYVCGATAFVDAASRYLIDAGVPFPSIRTERYGGDPVRA